MPKGTPKHPLDRTPLEKFGDPPICVTCGIEAVQRSGRWVCPVGWRAGHGQRRVKYAKVVAHEEMGRPIPHTKGRRIHNITAFQGIVECSCGADVERLPNGMWGCTTQTAQAMRGMEVAQFTQERQKRWAEARAESDRKRGVVESEADIDMVATRKTRSYTSLSGKPRGGEAVG